MTLVSWLVLTVSITQVRLVDCPALGYLTSDNPFPRGEVLARSLRMHTGGYFKRAKGARGGKADEAGGEHPAARRSARRGSKTAEGEKNHGGEKKEGKEDDDDGDGDDDDDDEEEDDDEDFVMVGGVRYFRTGDVGELVGPGEVRIIDRCKAHFKLAQVFIRHLSVRNTEASGITQDTLPNLST